MDNSQDLTTVDGVKKLMQNATSEQDWDERCDRVKAANGGYPEFWFRTIIMSGLVSEVELRWSRFN